MTNPDITMKVFISYAKEDVKTAKRLYDDLKREGFEPWYEDDILGGQNKEFEIKNAIEKGSSRFLVLLSSNSVSKRSPVLRHLKWASIVLDESPQNSIFIIPARLDDCDISALTIQQLQFVDLFPSYESGFGKILKSLGYEKPDKTPLITKSETEKPTIHPRPSVSKMCDRNPQANDFMDFFEKNRQTGRPQMYLIHGDTGECHDSFAERIKNCELRQFDGLYYPEQIPEWPELRDSEIRKRDLIYNLANKFGGKVSPDFTATDFGRLPCFDKRKLVIIRHNIDAFKWDKRHETDLILWYRDYWSKLVCDEKTPLFLIFLNIEYPKDSHVPLTKKMCLWTYCSPKNIETKLTRIAGMPNENCPCSVLSKLESVEESHVRHWLKEHAKMLEHKWEKIISEIFPTQTRKVSMNVVEAIFLKLLNEQDKTAWQ